ncbi:MAG: radical SAM family heme chaperone HemW [Dehalococcoidales bacterium]|nr:radical SAM family heme chaperone HemW [Dehalococcoidales bacterium]
MSCRIALYVHVPFCRRKCAYCDFVSYGGAESLIPAYVSALKREMAHYGGTGYQVGTVYFGGGTPSLLPVKALGELLEAIRQHFAVLADAEVSLEANPGTVDEAYLAAIRALGVNRLSLGMQSMDDRELAMLGRIHKAGDALAAFRMARNAGFDNINVDLIYGLPGQSVEGWLKSLKGVLALGTEHLSLYALSLEEGTPLWRAVNEGRLPPPDPDVAATQYELAEDILDAAGFRHYEISNWAKPGYECRHNLTYWHNLPYLGIGAGAHSFLNGHRYASTPRLNEYIEACLGGGIPPRVMDETIRPELGLAETVILALRLGEGVSHADIMRRFGTDILAHYGDVIGEMTRAGLLETTAGNIRLTRRGRLLSNEVCWRFLPDDVSEASMSLQG